MSNKLLILFIIISFSFGLTGQSWTVRHYSKNNILPTNFVNDLSQDDKGGLILATDLGLYRYNGSSISTLKSNYFYKKVVASNHFLVALTKNNRVHFFKDLAFVQEITIEDKADVIDIAYSSNTIYLLLKNRLITYSLLSNEKLIYPIKNAKNFILIDSEIFIVNGNKLTEFKSGTFKNSLEVKGQITSISADGDLLAVSTNTHVFDFKKENKGYTLYREKRYDRLLKVALLKDKSALIIQENLLQVQLNGSTDVLANSIFFNRNFHTVFVDRDGGVWLSEKGMGVYHIPNPEIVRYASDGVIKSVTNWLGQTVFSSNAGLILRNSQGEYTINFTHLDVSDCKEYNDQLILATKKGVFVLDSNFVLSKIADEVVNKIETDGNHLLYGTTDNKGLAVISIETKEISFVEIKNGLSHNIITDIERANGDTILVCTPAGGVDVISKGVVVNTHRFKFKQRVILNSLFYNRSKQDLYCATPNNGLFLIKKSNTIEQIPFDHAVYSIFEINQSIWITHNTGINILKNGRNVQIFEPNNLNNFFPFANGIYKSDKEIFLGIHEGFLKIVPRSNYFKQDHNYSYQYVVVNDEQTESLSELNLAYGQYRFKFLIDHINLTTKNNAALEWRMKGYNEVWNNVRNNTLEFPKLNNGSYTLEIKSSNGQIIEDLTVNINIDDPFWLKIWFWLLLVSLFILFVYLYSYYKTKNLVKEKNKLEKIVKERTVAIRRKNEELKQFAYVVSHDLKNPVVNISQLADLATDQNLPINKREEIVQHIKSSSEGLHKQLLGMIDLLKIDSNQLPMTEIDVPEMIHKILDSLDSFVVEANAKVVLNTKQFLITSNEQYLYSILYNLLSNALKYKSPKRDLILTIDLTKKSNKLHLSITDNGLGFNIKSQQHSLFQPFRRIHTTGEGTGLGLALTKRMIYALNGNILVDSKEDVGSTFELIFKT